MRIMTNTHVRLPTVVINIEGPNFPLPNINPSESSSGQWTSDGYPIDQSPYLLTFAIDTTLGYFDQQSFSYSLRLGQANTVFVFCNMVKNTVISPGVCNFIMYYVLNGVCGNGTPRQQKASFDYGLYYYDNTDHKHILQPAVAEGMGVLNPGGGGIVNNGED